MIKIYLKKLFEKSKRGDSTEESYYSTLEELLKKYADSTGRSKIQIIPLPKRTEAGNPDFKIWDGNQHIVGYIEAKAPTVEHLDQIERTDQLKRYLHTFPNLILTNFFEFRLYRNGFLIDKTLIARPFIIHKLKTIPPVEQESNFFKLLDKFFSFLLPRVYNAKTLAIELAKRTSFLKDEVIAEELKEEEQKTNSFILGFYEAFKKFLIGGLSKEEFADLYSQTITYGLFAARTRTKDGFNRKLAYDSIPHTIGILRDVFKFISLEDLPQQMEWIIDDIAEVLAVTDVKKILHKYFHEGKGKDPIVHFYETFLAEYDPQKRKKSGVYYTPEPVVSYIVRSLHHILKECFNKPDGFANESVTVLDPAAGTLTFLANAAKLAVKEFVSKYGEGGKEDFIKEHVLKNFYAFELMMAPYAVGHLKMSFLLEELGYKLKKDDRFKLYLTNTLEMEELAQTELPGMASLSEESHLAGEIKKEQPILAIIGNPPYSVSSANKSDFINKEMELYKEDVRDEKNIQPLSDDYIKFIRFAHWKIDDTGQGIIGMITNNSYLSGLIHRGIRKKLLESFDEIYILNLHGSSRIGEKTPEDGKDENVFDIQQGVSIAIYIKHYKSSKKKKVYYADCWGLRDKKYEYLLKNNINTTNWQELKPIAPYYFFIPKVFDLRSEYEKFWNLLEIFKKFSFGITTSRDSFVVGFTKEENIQKLGVFTGNLPDEIVKDALKLKDTGTWKLSKARQNVKGKNLIENISPYAYRPFDSRSICYESSLIERDRKDIMRHILNKDNIGLNLTRKLRDPIWRHVYVTFFITDKTLLSSRDNSYFFPLYLFSFSDKKDLFSNSKTTGKRQANINPLLFTTLSNIYKKEILPEEILYYIYAILYSNTYRKKFNEFLNIDFPRIPFAKDYKFFCKMAEYGKRLINFHLLKSKELIPPVAKLQGKGDNKVEILRYDKKEKGIYFNQSQYFEGITKEIWEYQIGGYQVCDKWLKDRRGRILILGDIKHYCKFATSIKKTIETQKEIDKLYPKIEEKILEFKTK